MRHMIIAIALVAAIAAESQALGTFNVTNAHITKQLSGAYRLRVDVDWDRAGMPLGELPPGYEWSASQYSPILRNFSISDAPGSFNFFSQIADVYNDGSDWTGPGIDGSLGMSFGYDFYAPENLTSRALDYSARIWYVAGAFVNIGPYNDYSPQILDDFERHTGSFSAQVVPEPSTLLLLGLGLVGVVRMRRKM